MRFVRLLSLLSPYIRISRIMEVEINVKRDRLASLACLYSMFVTVIIEIS